MLYPENPNRIVPSHASFQQESAIIYQHAQKYFRPTAHTTGNYRL